MTRPIVTLLTDFGQSDYFVSAMKGVILGICPEAQLVDITHNITPWQVAQGAWMLDQAWRTFPAGTVHLAVVDPGVGSERRPILAEAHGQVWVAPDNGLLSRVLNDAEAPSVREISAEAYFRQPVSATFHGRDIFAPVAGHLAAGVPPGQFGGLINDTMLLPPLVPVQSGPDEWKAEVLWVDSFGNIVTSLETSRFKWVADETFQLEIGNTSIRQYAQYYRSMEAGEAYLTSGSAGYLEIVINQQHAAKTLSTMAGRPLTLRRTLRFRPS